MNVTNLKSPRSGSPVANQYEITADDGTVTFQSYQTPIARKDGFKYTISKDWCYSVTTSKYFGQWLREYGFNDFEIKTLKNMLKRATAPTEFVQLLGTNVSIKLVEAL